MMLLFALWGLCLIVGFGFLQWRLQIGSHNRISLERTLFASGAAFFTLVYAE